MSRKQPRLPGEDVSQTASDFLLIKGIGPALARRLHEAGIHTFAQLASHSPAKLAAEISSLSVRQITSQDWIGQARTLARQKRTRTHRKAKAIAVVRQHYESFTVEFLLDERNTMRRTRVVHVQSGDSDTWAGWESGLLIDFLARHMSAATPAPPLAFQELVGKAQAEPSNEGSEPNRTTIRVPSGRPLLPEQTFFSPTGQNKVAYPAQIPQAISLADTQHPQNLNVLPLDSDNPICFLQQGEPYRLQIVLDPADTFAPDAITLLCEATIVLNQLDGPRHVMCDASRTLSLSDRLRLVLDGPPLDSGLYRLNAFVRLVPGASAADIKFALYGDLLQVY